MSDDGMVAEEVVMGKWKGLAKWKAEFGEKRGQELWIEARRARRKRTLETIKALSGIGFLLKLLNLGK